MGARRYLKDSVLEAIAERPIFSTSKDIQDSVNRNLKLKGWNKNMTTVRIGHLARLLADENLVIARRKRGKERINEFIAVSTLRQLT